MGGVNKILTIFLLTLLIPFYTLAATTTTPAPNPLDDPIARLVITESIKTREDLKVYMDTTLEKAVPELQTAVNANFKSLDQRINDFFLKARFTLAILWFCTTILGFLTIEIILRKVYKRATKSRTYQEDNTPLTNKNAFSPEQINQMTIMMNEILTKNAIVVPKDEQTRKSHPDDTFNTPVSPSTPPSEPQKQGWFHKWMNTRKQKKNEKKARKALQNANKQAKRESEKIKKQLAELQKAQATISRLETLLPPQPPSEPEQKSPTEIREDHILKILQKQEGN